MKFCNTPLVLLLLAAVGNTATARSPKALKKTKKGKKGKKMSTSSLGFDPQEWVGFDGVAKSFDAGYIGDYNTIDTAAISEMYIQEGSVFLFDLGSFGSLIRRRGVAITLSEIRTIWYELSPIAGDNNGIVMKSVGDSLQMYFDNVSDGLIATRAMYLALIARWKDKVALACDDAEIQPAWCGVESEERKLFFNTAAVGGGYGEMIVIPNDGTPVDAFGAAVNNAYFAGEEEAEHGQTIIDDGALQSLLGEKGVGPFDCGKESTIPWTAGDFGIDHLITINYGFACYYTVCFDAECKIPDDE
mmetsp:Transcript_54523/g.63734  ORF Transcript_54523/g.63734 Transcript_54523/m.63734 type:complete len:302 (+) Transcript_54523:123-1028(+)